MRLRPYQAEIARAVLDSIENQRGITFSVEIARQGGKNELSAHLELLLLAMHMLKGGNLVKCSPTFKPQTVISMSRLKQRLDDFGFDGIWLGEMGYIIRLGAARQVFLSADESSSVVGHTADILLEIDESQDVNGDKYSKEFRPMASSTNATTVHYGTTWDDASLLEQVKQSNLELERADGIRRHFRYDWQEVARYNPAYATFVESEKLRLGENHPLFRSQYALLPVRSGGGFLSRGQISLMQGSHTRQRARFDRKAVYVAGIDIAGETGAEMEVNAEAALKGGGRDATVVTVAEVCRCDQAPAPEPGIKVVEHCCWVGRKHAELYPLMVDILKNRWSCSRVVIDATGMGEPVASFLHGALGSRVIPFKFTRPSKSSLGFDLLAAINSGRLQLYAPDGSDDYREIMFELERARGVYYPDRTLNFYVDPVEGHDDYLMSLALCVKAAEGYEPRRAVGH